MTYPDGESGSAPAVDTDESHEIAITMSVRGVDPARTDPLDIAEYLMSLYDDERRAGNGPSYELASDSLEAEWSR